MRTWLRYADLGPAGRRGGLTWREFVRAHSRSIIAADFFTVETVWLQRLYVLFFIELGSRRVHFAGCTPHPNALWVTQQARQLTWTLNAGFRTLQGDDAVECSLSTAGLSALAGYAPGAVLVLPRFAKDREPGDNVACDFFPLPQEWVTAHILHLDQPRATTRSIAYFLTGPFPRCYSTFFLAPETHDDFGAPPLPGSLATDQTRL